MPLAETPEGKECPLGRWELDRSAGRGAYTRDRVEVCPPCNFSDMRQEEFDLDKICQCPPELTSSDYPKLLKQYSATTKVHSREGFWEFVRDKYPQE